MRIFAKVRNKGRCLPRCWSKCDMVHLFYGDLKYVEGEKIFLPYQSGQKNLDLELL